MEVSPDQLFNCNYCTYNLFGEPLYFSTPGLTERPYLSEAGCEALDHLWSVHMFNLQLIDPTIQLARRQVVQMDKLVRDIVNLLLGVPSTSFLLNEVSVQFSFNSHIKLYITSLSVLLYSLSTCNITY